MKGLKYDNLHPTRAPTSGRATPSLLASSVMEVTLPLQEAMSLQRLPARWRYNLPVGSGCSTVEFQCCNCRGRRGQWRQQGLGEQEQRQCRHACLSKSNDLVKCISLSRTSLNASLTDWYYLLLPSTPELTYDNHHYFFFFDEPTP